MHMHIWMNWFIQISMKSIFLSCALLYLRFPTIILHYYNLSLCVMSRRLHLLWLSLPLAFSWYTDREVIIPLSDISQFAFQIKCSDLDPGDICKSTHDGFTYSDGCIVQKCFSEDKASPLPGFENKRCALESNLKLVYEPCSALREQIQKIIRFLALPQEAVMGTEVPLKEWRKKTDFEDRYRLWRNDGKLLWDIYCGSIVAKFSISIVMN